jgi:sarcosine/dimethylglycine N-methyltransferase
VNSRISISAMPLYATIGRVRNELNELGQPETLRPEHLYSFDQIHYRGTDAVRDAAETLGVSASHHLLDIGSGIGGPARFLADTTGCRVLALELQADMHALGEALTSRCRLADRVAHVCGDALTYPLAADTFDAAVSWLAIHHIPQRPRLLRRICASLRPGGCLYVEDLYERAPFTDADRPDVEQMLYGVTMTSTGVYERDLAVAGFADTDVTDVSDEWGAFCDRRAASWRADVARHTRVHGEEIVTTLDRFFATVARLFASGRLGGLRIVARKT